MNDNKGMVDVSNKEITTYDSQIYCTYPPLLFDDILQSHLDISILGELILFGFDDHYRIIEFLMVQVSTLSEV